MECNYHDSWYELPRYVDENGESVKRTREEYPYSYDPYVIWQSKYNKSKSNIVYSDRLVQWDYNKYNKCCKEVFGNESQYFDNRDSKSVEKFLSKYFDKEIKLTLIMEGCNVSNGFPYWVFGFEYVD